MFKETLISAAIAAAFGSKYPVCHGRGSCA